MGRSIYNLLSLNFNCHAINRSQLDCLNLNKVNEFFNNNIYDLIINCVAYTNVDKAEIDKKEALILNAELPLLLAQISNKQKIPLIHFSTNYVYSGLKIGPYNENDIEEPLNFYGHTKLLGDNSIIESQCKGLIIRLGWVYSLTGNNFFNKIIKKFYENKRLYVVDDQFSSPTSSNFVAEIILDFLSIKNIDKLKNFQKFNLSPKGNINFYQLSKWILSNLNLNKNIEITPIKSDFYKLAAKRPLNSHMTSDLLLKYINYDIPIWQKHANQFIKNKNLDA